MKILSQRVTKPKTTNQPIQRDVFHCTRLFASAFRWLDTCILVKGRSSGSLAQLAEYSHGKREPWVRVPIGSRSFLDQCGFAARARSIKKCMSRCFSVVLSRFGDGSYSAGGKCQMTTKWLVSSVGKSARRVSSSLLGVVGWSEGAG